MARACRPHNPMPESRYEVLALFTGAMVGATLFIMATGTLLPIFEQVFHLNQAQCGLVLSVQMVGAVLTTSVAGALTDRFGDKKVVLWASWFMGIALVIGALVHSYQWMLFWLLIYGIGFAAVTPAGSHAIVFFFPKEQRGLAMGIRQCGMPLGGVVGSIFLPLIALRFGYDWSLVAAGIATAFTGTMASMLYREPQQLAGENVSIKAMIVEMLAIGRDSRLILITLCSMALVSAQAAVMAFLPLTFVHEAAVDVRLGVLFFTISQVGACCGRLAWGWISDHVFKGARALPLAVVCAVTALACLATSLASPSMPMWALGAIAVVLGFSAVGWFGLSVIAIAEIGGEEHSGGALGVSITWIFLAGFIAPTIFGLLASAEGYAFAWRALAVVQLLGIWPALLGSVLIQRLTAGARAAA